MRGILFAARMPWRRKDGVADREIRDKAIRLVA
jgi:hypothetical protein